jgi:hypothetical protein
MANDERRHSLESIFMSYFITVAIPRGLELRLREVLSTEIWIEPYDNPSITKRVPSGYECFTLTSGDRDSRDSDALYGGIGDAGKDEIDPVETARKKYERLGWSEPKIERAIASLRVSVSERTKEHFVGLRPDIAASLSKIAQAHGKIYIVVHSYSRLISSERLTLKTIVIPRGRLDDPNYQFPEDTLAEVAK